MHPARRGRGALHFAAAAGMLQGMSLIDSTAHVHPGARLGAGVRVGPGAVIGEHAEIGDECEIRAHAVVAGWTRMGARNQIGYGAVIGAEPQDLSFAPETVSWVEIGDGNVIREHATIHRGTKPDSGTRVGSGCYFMAGAHVGHNCVVGDHVILANNVLLGGYVEVGDRAFLSGNAVVHQFCRVGRLGLLRGLGGISKDIPPFMIGGAINSLMGLNTVGLRRAGFSPEARMRLKRLFHDLFRSGRNLSDAMAAVEATGEAAPEVAEVLAFVRAAKRGVVTLKGGDGE